MVGVQVKPGIGEKLEILSRDGQYDLACACGSGKDDHRRRGADGKWIYPVTLPNGGSSVLFKSLISNVCNNDCKYCPLREGQDVRRCSLKPTETAEVFLDYYRRKKVFGLFLSSGVIGSADATMERLCETVRILRSRHGFRGYVHLKVLPGASDAAIEEAVRLSSAVSINIETPGEENLRKLSSKKDFLRDIVRPMKLISRLTGRGGKYKGRKQTTQFIVGAAGESDSEIVRYMGRLYDGLGLSRVYFSAYQRGLGDGAIEADRFGKERGDAGFVREHRLYQVDFLMRKYGFAASEMVFGDDGRLSLEADPKEAWAKGHPERFPVDVNCAGKLELLRVPGLGPVSVKRILERRKQGRLGGIEDIGKVGALLLKAEGYLVF
jgi:predicted DNA-binding helix-hairpin-helix protein